MLETVCGVSMVWTIIRNVRFVATVLKWSTHFPDFVNIKLITLLLKLNLLHRQLLWRKLWVHLIVARWMFARGRKSICNSDKLVLLNSKLCKVSPLSRLSDDKSTASSRGVRSSASSPTSVALSFRYHPVAAHVIFLIFLPLLSCLLSFPSFACYRRHFLRNMWPIHLVSLLFWCT